MLTPVPMHMPSPPGARCELPSQLQNKGEGGGYFPPLLVRPLSPSPQTPLPQSPPTPLPITSSRIDDTIPVSGIVSLKLRISPPCRFEYGFHEILEFLLNSSSRNSVKTLGYRYFPGKKEIPRFPRQALFRKVAVAHGFHLFLGRSLAS